MAAPRPVLAGSSAAATGAVATGATFGYSALMHRRAPAWTVILAGFLMLAPAGRSGATPPLGSDPQLEPGALDCLALTVYFEAGYEQREGMIGVGWVVLNRRAHPEFPTTVCEVVRQGGEVPGCQFSYWCDGKPDTPRDGEGWARARAVAEAVLANRVSDPTGGALFFHSTSLDAVPWGLPRSPTVRIGGHLFYR